jgi:hypothetical protein
MTPLTVPPSTRDTFLMILFPGIVMSRGAQTEELMQVIDYSLALPVNRDHVVTIIQQNDSLLRRGDFVIDELGVSGARHVILSRLQDQGWSRHPF